MKREDRRYKYAVHTSPAQHCVRDCDNVCDIEFIANHVAAQSIVRRSIVLGASRANAIDRQALIFKAAM
jgi:hypothetical protein